MEKRSVNILFLTEPEMIEAGVLNVKECVETMDDAFKLLGKGDCLMGDSTAASHGVMLWYPTSSPFPNMPLAGPDRRYMAMIAYLGGKYNMTGVKWYGSNVANPREEGIPRSVLMVGLNDAKTGEPIAIMSANLLSAMRTGCVPGIATKYLARKGAESLGIVGCGVISRACARGMLYNMPNKKTLILNDIKQEAAEKFAEEFKAEFPELNIVIEPSLEKTIRESDVISVAAAGPVPVKVKKEWLKPGCLYTATGHSELDEEIWTDNTVVFDYWPMHEMWLHEGQAHPDGIESTKSWAASYDMFKLIEAGKAKAEDQLSLSDVAIGKVQPRKSDDDVIVFISGGMPIEDVAWGTVLYRNAKEKGLGTNLKIWDQSHWM